MNEQEVYVFEIKRHLIQNAGAGSITNHLKLTLEQVHGIASCHIDSICFVPHGEIFIVTVLVSDIDRP